MVGYVPVARLKYSGTERLTSCSSISGSPDTEYEATGWLTG